MIRTPKKNPAFSTALWTIIGFLSLFILNENAFAGRISITPSGGIELDSSMKFGAITMANNGAEPVEFDISVFEWMQDAEGKDVFTETMDLVVFPREMLLQAGEHGAIRLGYRGSEALWEKTFRIFIAERTNNVKNESGSRPAAPISIPVFIKPTAERIGANLSTLVLSDNALTFAVKSTGNKHLLVLSVNIRGLESDGRGEIFNRNLAGSYVLSEMVKYYHTIIPTPICRNLSQIEVQINTNAEPLSGTIAVDADMCKF